MSSFLSSALLVFTMVALVICLFAPIRGPGMGGVLLFVGFLLLVQDPAYRWSSWATWATLVGAAGCWAAWLFRRGRGHGARSYFPLERVEPHAAVAYLVGIPAVLIILETYLSYPTFLGQFPKLWLFIVCGVGTSLGFALYVGPVYRAGAFISGLAAGLGGAAFFASFGHRLHEIAPWFAPELAFLVGAVPGVVVLGLRQRLFRR